MHCVNHVDVPARLAKPSKVNRVKKPNVDSKFQDKLFVFYEVEHILIVFSRELSTRSDPELVKIQRSVVCFDVCESGVHVVILV